MPQYAIREGNLPAEVNVNGGRAKNFGPGTVVYGDSQDVTATNFEGSIAPGSSITLEGTQWFTTDVGRSSLFVEPGTAVSNGTQGPRGPAGADGTGFRWRGAWDVGTAYAVGDVVFRSAAESSDGFTTYIAVAPNSGVTPADSAAEWDGITIAGPAGPPGPAGSAVANAVVGQDDRFYKTLAGTLENEGGITFWSFQNDEESRPQNLDSVAADSDKIVIDYSSLRASHVGSIVVTPDEALRNAGISATVDADLSRAHIKLVQDKRLSDLIYWDGAAWGKSKAIKTPWTLSGLDSTATDISAYLLAQPNLVSYYRFSESSGTTLTDASTNAYSGTIVSTGATFGVAGGIPGETATNKALKTAAGGTNELTFALMGHMDQTAFSVAWYGKLDPNATVVFRDGSGAAGTGYYVAWNNDKVAVRFGTVLTTTTVPWSLLNDGKFHLVVMTKVGTAGKLYIDGTLVASITNATTTALASPWHIGRTGQNGTAAASQSVTIDELAFFNAALSAQQVANVQYALTATGLLTISHEEAGDTDESAIVVSDRGDGTARPRIVAVRSTGFDVEFLDGSSNRIRGATTAMRIAVARTISQRPVDPQNFTAVKFIEAADYGPTMLATEPRSYLRLGDAAGSSTAHDLGSTAADGVVAAGVTMGATGLLSGDPDTAATFDGAQGKITIASPALPANTPFSVKVWFECTGAGSVGATQYATIVGWSTSGTRRLLYDITNSTIRAETGGAILTAPNGSAGLVNTRHLLVYVFDGQNQEIWIDGILAASGATNGNRLDSTLFLGSYLATSTNYSFKGTLDEFGWWARALKQDEILQLLAAGTQTTIKQDASIGASINVYGLVEAFAPLPDNPGAQPLPTKTALPARDGGSGAALLASLAPYRSSILASSSVFKKSLPADVAGRNAILLNGYTFGGTPYAAATSDNWRRFMCSKHGYDPDTPQSQALANFVGASQGLAWADITELLYVVPADQPLRVVTDTVTGFGASVFNQVVNRIGGLPIPADARPHATADRYLAVYSPSMDLLATLYDARPSDSATVTLTCTGSPTAGSQIWKFLFIDSQYTEPVEFFCGTFLHHNATAAEVQAAILAATGPNGRSFGSTATTNARPGTYGPGIVVTGGPLNVAPITITFPSCEALRCPGFTILENSFNVGTVHFGYHNAGPIDTCRLGAVIVPSTDGHVGGVSAFSGIYTDTNDLSSFQWRSHYWPATATSLDMFSLIPSVDELQAAKLAGTGLGHCLVMSVGQAQNQPFAYVPPATRGDGAFVTADGSAAPEGARWTFPPDVDLSAVIPEMLPIAMTIRDHGIIPIDKTGIGMDFGKFRDTRFPGLTVPAGQAYDDYFSLYKTASNASHLYNRCLPWHKLQAIDPAATW